MKVFFVGDIVGSPGRNVFVKVVKRYREEGRADFVVVNAENAAGGRGLTAGVAEDLLKSGADVITLGDHTWDQKEFAAYLDQPHPVIRPLNFAPGCPGRGWFIAQTGFGPVAVVTVLGRVFMKPVDCPFRAVDALIARELSGVRMIIVDFHAEATSEKIVMGRYLDGRVSCMAGTHTHVQTSDETILPNGTAYITDLGMTGPKDSAIGRDLAAVTSSFLTGMPAKFGLAKDEVMLEGVLVDVDRETGRSRGIVRVRERLAP
jgi:metallophosphoesterase (TIGR00282 family)